VTLCTLESADVKAVCCGGGSRRYNLISINFFIENLCRMLSTYHLTEEDARYSSDHLLPPEGSLPGMTATSLPAVPNRLPVMELMKVFNDIYLCAL